MNEQKLQNLTTKQLIVLDDRVEDLKETVEEEADIYHPEQTKAEQLKKLHSDAERLNCPELYAETKENVKGDYLDDLFEQEDGLYMLISKRQDAPLGWKC